MHKCRVQKSSGTVKVLGLDMRVARKAERKGNEQTLSQHFGDFPFCLARYPRLITCLKNMGFLLLRLGNSDLIGKFRDRQKACRD